ncbi:MAG: hypothetical protein ACN6P1_10655 [Pseudomonas sp.]|uniref:hypothetical protein n=1 Tax=Pseudomonas sp. TaxID=306 RepID=UPI003D1321F8
MGQRHRPCHGSVVREGVPLAAADAVFFSADIELAADVQVGQGAHVAAFSRLENIRIEAAERA